MDFDDATLTEEELDILIGIQELAEELETLEQQEDPLGFFDDDVSLIGILGGS